MTSTAQTSTQIQSSISQKEPEILSLRSLEFLKQIGRDYGNIAPGTLADEVYSIMLPDIRKAWGNTGGTWWYNVTLPGSPKYGRSQGLNRKIADSRQTPPSDDRFDEKTMGVKKSMNDGLGAPYSIMCGALSPKLAKEVKDDPDHKDLQVTVDLKPKYTTTRVTMTVTSKIDYLTTRGGSKDTIPTCHQHTEAGPKVTIVGLWSEKGNGRKANDTDTSGRWDWHFLEEQANLDESVSEAQVCPDVEIEAMSKATLGEDERLGTEGSTDVERTGTARSKGMSSWVLRGMKRLQGRAK